MKDEGVKEENTRGGYQTSQNRPFVGETVENGGGAGARR